MFKVTDYLVGFRRMVTIGLNIINILMVSHSGTLNDLPSAFLLILNSHRDKIKHFVSDLGVKQ